MVWEIHPYIGLSDLTFDLNVSTVVAKLGQPSQQRRMPSGRIRFMFGSDKPAIVFEDERLVEIATVPDLSDPLMLGTTSIYEKSPREIITEISKLDKDVYQKNGFLVCFNLGIALTGFHDDDPNQKAVVMFRKGFHWANQISEMEKFSPD
ncbi:hypothetical protein [Aureimonas psammosilenae]|uniref:hypothetical protein n=1 Tax=Aureimonas psammosilenae TaxID=2495496 RepID=UPI001260EC81|nr:hypothetical protein [Aureimonas psammosilenae]